MSSAASPTRFLVVVTVTLFDNGEADYAYLEFFQNKSLPEKKLRGVATADLIGWAVTVKSKGRKIKAPFRIEFESDELLGVRTIDVKAGGVSEFFPTRALGGTFKYSVSLPTFPTAFADDPEVQMDTMAAFLPRDGEKEGDAYSIDGTLTSAGEFSFTYTRNSSAPAPLPPVLDVMEGDRLTWTLRRDTPRPPTFQVVFDDRGLYSLPVVGDPLSNTIEGDRIIGAMKASTATKIARQLGEGQAPDFPYEIRAAGFSSGSYTIRLSNRPEETGAKSC